MTIQEFLDTEKAGRYPMADYFYPKILNDDGFVCQINYMSVLDKYNTHLSQYIETVELTLDEAKKYRFAPKTVSKDIYGSTHMWWLLMHANQLHTTTQFDFTETLRMKVFTARGLSEVNTCLNQAVKQMNFYKENAIEDRKNALAAIAAAEYEATQVERKQNLGSGTLRMSEKLVTTK